MYRWIQPEDGAMPWEDAVRAMPPAAKNTTDLRVTDTERFRINFSMEGRDNYGALQLGDITLKAYAPDCTERPDMDLLPGPTATRGMRPLVVLYRCCKIRYYVRGLEIRGCCYIVVRAYGVLDRAYANWRP